MRKFTTIELALACVIIIIVFMLGWAINVTLNIFAHPTFSQLWILSHGDADTIAYVLIMIGAAATIGTAYAWKYKLKQTINFKMIKLAIFLSIFIVAILWSIGVSSDYFAQPCFSQFWMVDRATADLLSYALLIYPATGLILSPVVWQYYRENKK